MSETRLGGVLKRLALTRLPEPLLEPLKRWHYARSLRRLTEADEPDLHVVRRLVSPGDHVVDAGAHVGLYTRFLSERVGASGRVYAVEPVPATFRLLESTTRRLRLRNVRTLPFALSDGSRPGWMQIPAYAAGGQNYYEAHLLAESGPHGGEGGVRVACRTLDELLRGAPDPIGFLKCDVEGHELECLQGALATLQASRPSLLVEISADPDRAQTRGARALELLAGLGYAAYWFDGRRLRRRQAGDRSVNYFFLREEHLARPGLPL